MVSIDFLSNYSAPLVIGLGFFDSVHYGHRAIIERVKRFAEKKSVTPALFTFSDNAYAPFNPEAKLIYTFDERKTVLADLGLDVCVYAAFDEQFRAMDRGAFLSALCSRFSVEGIVCGYDYRFGAGGKGETSFLQGFCAARNIELDIVDEIDLGGVRVSSTEIKRCLLDGNVEKANCYLCQPFFMTGTVVKGRGEGHIFGFPTANLAISEQKLTPKVGVYATRTTIDGAKYKSVTNVGSKPTFGDMDFSVETMIDGVHGDLYGKTMTVEFLQYLRPIQKFDSPESLRAQIESDMRK